MSVAPLNLLDLYGTENLLNVKFLIESTVVLSSATITSCIPDHPYPTDHTAYPGPSGNDYTTVYTTECIQVCPTETPCAKGTKTDTYTITETCTGDINDYTRPPIPPNFTTTEAVCDVCEGKPTLTITCPTPEETSPPMTNEGNTDTGCTDCHPEGGVVPPASGNGGGAGTPAGKNTTGQYIQAGIASSSQASMVLGGILCGLLGITAWLL